MSRSARLLHAVLAAALWIALGIAAAKATHDFYRYADHSIYAAVDDSESNIAYSLASSGRYGFPASPVLTGIPRTHGQFNYGPWYFYLAGMLVWIFGFSLTLVRSIHLWGILGSIGVAAWWFDARERPAATALFGFGVLYAFETSQWPEARPDIMVSVFALALLVCAGLGIDRHRPMQWFAAGLAAACGALSHLIAVSLLPSVGLLFAVAAYDAIKSAPDRSAAWRHQAGSAAALAAGVALGVTMFYASFGFALERQIRFLSAYRNLTKSSNGFVVTVKYHLAYAFGYLSPALQIVVGLTLVTAWIIVAVSWKLPSEERRVARAYVLPPIVVWSGYLLSNGFYTSHHTGYAILHQVLFLWTAAAMLWLLLRCARLHFRAGALLGTLAIALLMVLAGRQLSSRFSDDSWRALRVATWVPFSEYSAEVLAPIPLRAVAWGSLLFGLESPDRLQLVSWVDAVTLFARVQPADRASLIPDFLIWTYPEVRDQMLMATRFANEGVLGKTAELLSDSRWRVAALVAGAPYGVTRTYARYADTSRAPSRRLPSISIYDPEHRQWLRRPGMRLPVEFRTVAPVELRLGYEAEPPPSTPKTTVAADLPLGRYLLKVAVKPGAGATRRRLLAVTSATMLKQTISELGPEGDFAAYLADDADVFMLSVHPGGTLYVSQFDGGVDPGISAVEVYPMFGLLDPDEGPRRQQPLPELTKWDVTKGITATLVDNALHLDGNSTSSGYQMSSPLIRARAHDRVTAKMATDVQQGHVCPGVLNATGLKWLVAPDKPRAELAFEADDTAGFHMVFANCNWQGETAPTRFTVQPGTYVYEPGGLYSDRLVDAGLQPEFTKSKRLADLVVKTFPAELVVRQSTIDSPGDNFGPNDFVYRAPIVQQRSDTTWSIRGRADTEYSYLMRAKDRRLTGDDRVIVAGRVEQGGLSIGLLQNDKWTAQVNVTEPGDFTVVIAPPGRGTYSILVASNLPHGLDISMVLTKVGLAPK